MIKYRIDIVSRYSDIDLVEGQELFNSEHQAKSVVSAIRSTLSLAGIYPSMTYNDYVITMIEVSK